MHAFFTIQRGGWLLAMVTWDPDLVHVLGRGSLSDSAGGNTVWIGHAQIARRAIMPHPAYSDFQK